MVAHARVPREPSRTCSTAHTLLGWKRPKPSRAGQHHAPTLLSSPGTGHPLPTAQNTGLSPAAPGPLSPVLGSQQLRAPRSSWALSTAAARSPAPQPPWHPHVLAPSPLRPGQTLPWAPPCSPCMHGRGWEHSHAGAQYCTSLLFLCGTRRGGRGKRRRSRIKPRGSFGRSRAQRAASHPSGTRVGPRLLPLALGLKRHRSTQICPRRSARASLRLCTSPAERRLVLAQCSAPRPRWWHL